MLPLTEIAGGKSLSCYKEGCTAFSVVKTGQSGYKPVSQKRNQRQTR